MRFKYRWDLALSHRGAGTTDFLNQYFDRSDRTIVVIGGAGFDPRSTIFPEQIGALTHPTVRAILLKEERPGTENTLTRMADENYKKLTQAIPAHEVLPVMIFESDNSVIGGRSLVRQMSTMDFTDATDIVVDMSALSVGIGFPLIRLLVDNVIHDQCRQNLHIVVAHHPEQDTRIHAYPSDTPGPVHGFKGGLSLVAGTMQPAKLWLPQLARRYSNTLRRIYDRLIPDEVCAIVPFPAIEARLGDALLEELLDDEGIPWQMDSRSIVYADEGDPLDLYRTIMRLHALREPVFEETGGSKLILTPVGSKVMVLGSLLAALELDLPVFYLEDFSYELVDSEIPLNYEPNLLHVWLEGDPYHSFDRPLLQRF